MTERPLGPTDGLLLGSSREAPTPSQMVYRPSENHRVAAPYLIASATLSKENDDEAQASYRPRRHHHDCGDEPFYNLTLTDVIVTSAP
jgi:hypothetical protein